jgi:dihydrofolate reductase
MKAIVATNNLGYIGKDGKMMWRCSADFKHFKKITMGGVLIVGATTYKNDMPNGLPGRTCIVVGNSEYYTLPLFRAVKEAIQMAYSTLGDKKIRDIWVIGGASIYKQLIYLCDEVHISIINNNDVGDVKFELPSDYRGKVFKYNFEPNAPVSS